MFDVLVKPSIRACSLSGVDLTPTADVTVGSIEVERTRDAFKCWERKELDTLG